MAAYLRPIGSNRVFIIFILFYNCITNQLQLFIVVISDVFNAIIMFYFWMNKKEYIQRNRQWLADKAHEPGVQLLDKGICYKVIRKGDPSSPTPNRGSVVTVHYTGRTINGKTFDSSRSGVAPALRLRELIPGWIIALQKMHPCDRWEVYIPAEQAYGNKSIPGIPGGSTLVFDIELIDVM
jgi:peptidylprolyl isomerase